MIAAIAGAAQGDRKLLKQALEIAATIDDAWEKAEAIAAIAGAAQGDRKLLEQALEIAVSIDDSRPKAEAIIGILECDVWNEAVYHLKETISLEDCLKIIPVLLSNITNKKQQIVEVTKAIQCVPQWFHHKIHGTFSN